MEISFIFSCGAIAEDLEMSNIMCEYITVINTA